MIKIYDTTYTFVGYIDKVKDMCITSVLETGLQNLSFKLPLTPENIEMVSEEYYVETQDYNYVIKEINMDRNDFFTVYCNANVEDLKGNVLPTFDAIDINIITCIENIINQLNLPWTVESNITMRDRVQYALAHKTVWECLQQVKEDYKLEYWFDTKAKKIYIYTAMGAARGVAFMNELRLQALTRQGQTYDFATILYPIGKNGLTIANINNGKQYIENFDYSTKRITAYYVNEDIEYAEDLKRLAEDYLSVVSCPVVSYKVQASSLPKNLNIGDTIILIDKLKKIKQQQRVVRIKHYPYTPEKDEIELSNEVVNFAKTYQFFNSEYRKTIKYVKDNIAGLQ